MKFNLRRIVGTTEIVFSDEAKDGMDFFKKAGFYCEFPNLCGHCNSANLRIQYREPKGYSYAQVVCLDCHWELKFGQHLEGGTLFAKGWEAPYNPSNDIRPMAPGPRGKQSPPMEFAPPDENEVPF